MPALRRRAPWFWIYSPPDWIRPTPSAPGKDPKTRLQELLQSRKRPLPEYLVVAIDGDQHDQTFTVNCLLQDAELSTKGSGTQSATRRAGRRRSHAGANHRMTESAPTRCGYVAIIGRPNVGKSTLLNRILGQKLAITSHKAQTTRHAILGIKTLPEGQILFVDTPGIHQRGGSALNRYLNRAARATIADTDLALLVVEATALDGRRRQGAGGRRHGRGAGHRRRQQGGSGRRTRRRCSLTCKPWRSDMTFWH